MLRSQPVTQTIYLPEDADADLCHAIATQLHTLAESKRNKNNE